MSRNKIRTNNKLTSCIENNQLAYINLVDTCKTAPTRYLYDKSCKYFMRYLRLNEDNSYDKLLERHPKMIQADISQFIVFLRNQKCLSSRTIKSYTAGLKHFYDMNEITELNWKKINSFQPEHEDRAEDRPYTREEIQRLLEVASQRDRGVVLLMASAGLRVGAIPPLTIKSLEPIDKYGIYKITVYKKSKSQYFSFCTPETRREIDAYLEWRTRMGERLKPDSPLFRKEFDIEDPMRANNPQPLSVRAIGWTITKLLKDSGVRIPQKLTEQNTFPKRTEIMTCHGFRKFFDTAATNAGMNPLYIDILEGHAAGLKYRYFKPTELQLLEGNDKMLGYLSVIDALTINEQQRLKKKVADLTEKQDDINQIKYQHSQEMESMRTEMNQQLNQIMSMIQKNPKLAHIKPKVLMDRSVQHGA